MTSIEATSTAYHRFARRHTLPGFADTAVLRGLVTYEQTEEWDSLSNLADFGWTAEQMLGLMKEWKRKGDEVDRAYVLSYAVKFLPLRDRFGPEATRNWLRHIIMTCEQDLLTGKRRIVRTALWRDIVMTPGLNEREFVAAWHVACGDDLTVIQAALSARILDPDEFLRLRADLSRDDLLERLRTLAALTPADRRS